MTQNVSIPVYPPAVYLSNNVKLDWMTGEETAEGMIRELHLELQTARDAYQHLNQCYVELQAEFREYKAALDRCEIPL